METRKRTTAGFLFWTPAPIRPSSPSSVDSEDVWEDEDEEKTEKEDDFLSQMDENGIIGLSEALKDVELGGACGDADAECGDLIGNFKALTVDEEVKQRKEEQGTECLPERDKYLDTTEEEKDGLGAGVIGSYVSEGETEEPLVVSNQHCPISQSASPATAPTFSRILLSAGEEIAAAPGIEAETLPEMSLIESLPESHKSHISLKSSPRCPSIMLRASPQPTATFSEEVIEVKHRKQPTPSPRMTRQHSLEATYSSCSLSTDGADSSYQTTSPDREQRTPRAKSKAAEEVESRKGPLSHPTPDFSKVEPRVRFPKGGYKPPKSRRPLSPEPPLLFTSPVDIVKEVLLNVHDGPPATSDSYRPTTSAPNFAVPQEFRCRQHAIALLEQLQEDYNTLLTKYADAENTIDRLRLEAKVNLYSDPPKPGHRVPSRLNQEASRFMMLDFPQAQRANINSASLHPNTHSTHQESSSACPSTRSPDPQVGQQPAKILYVQADQFLQQLQTFEDLLKRKTLKPAEQVKGLLQLAEGLDSLESGYLLARDEHTLLLEESAEMSQFDPERELEGLIFQFGLHMDELREQADQMQQDQPTCEAPPSPHPHLTPSSVPSEETRTHPQSPAVASLVDPAEAAAEEVSSASEERDEEMENGEMENSLYLKPLNGKHRHDEQDFAALTDHYQSFKKIPKLLYHSQMEGAPLPAALRTDMHPGDEEKERQSQGTGNLEVQKGHPQRKTDHEDSPPLHTRKQLTHRSGPPSCRASNQSTTLPADPPSSRRKFKVRKSHSSSLSSLADITASERRNSTFQTGSSRVLSQEGIISPEMDSGFVGSESSRLTPAAAPSPLHQRAAETVSVPQEWNPGKPQTGLVSAPSPASLPSHRHTGVEEHVGSQLSPDRPRRTRQEQRRRTSPCSPQRWVSQKEQSRADCGINEFGMENDSSDTVSEDGQNDRYTESLDSLNASSLSSSLDSSHHLRALGSSHVANRNHAIQTLQDEVTKLKERLESCLRNTKPQSFVRAAQKNQALNRTTTPRIRSRERLRDVSRGRREVEDYTMRQTARERPPSPHRQKPQPDILITSEPTISQPKTLVSRCTQTSSAASDGYCSHANTVHRRTHTRQHPGVSVQVCETADEPDSRNPARLCPQCLSHHQRRSKGSAGSNKETSHSCFRHCPLCGYPEPYRGTEPDSPTHTSRQPSESSDGGMRSRNFAAEAPPALLRYMPVGVPPLLLHSLPLYVSPSNSTGTSSGVRGRKETRRRSRRSLSTDEQRFVDNSLDRAIRAARHMKLTSGHMARSLAAGLHHQERLNQSCS